MNNLVTELKRIEQDLANFVSPENKDGFVKEFASWVYAEWSKNTFYDHYYVDVGYDCSSHPEATNKLLADEYRTYAEFINANTGVSKCTFVSGHGMACEEYSDKLQELFGDACSKKLDELIALYGLEVPDKYKKNAENISELIFHEVVDYNKDSELHDVCENILFRFNQLGVEQEPYACSLCGWDEVNDAPIYGDEAVFKDYSLEDFKKLAEFNNVLSC